MPHRSTTGNVTKNTPKRARNERSMSESPTPKCCTENKEILLSIQTQLTGFEARLSLIEVLHKEIQALRHSLEFSQEQIDTLKQENKSLTVSIQSLTTQLSTNSVDLKNVKATILDLQTRSMRDNLIFSSILEPIHENPEATIRAFMSEQLKLPAETVQSISFHRVHRIQSRNNRNDRPRPIVAKFEHFKQKELVQRQGKHLKGTDFGLNDQYPKEILQRRKQLFPIRKQMREESKKAVIVVDKLYINDQLYRDKTITPWLF